MESAAVVIMVALMYGSLYVAWRAVDMAQRSNRRLMNEVADLREQADKS